MVAISRVAFDFVDVLVVVALFALVVFAVLYLGTVYEVTFFAGTFDGGAFFINTVPGGLRADICIEEDLVERALVRCIASVDTGTESET